MLTDNLPEEVRKITGQHLASLPTGTRRITGRILPICLLTRNGKKRLLLQWLKQRKERIIAWQRPGKN